VVNRQIPWARKFRSQVGAVRKAGRSGQKSRPSKFVCIPRTSSWRPPSWGSPVSKRQGRPHKSGNGLAWGDGRAWGCNAPRRTRTCNLRFRRPMLYPIELGVLLTTRSYAAPSLVVRGCRCSANNPVNAQFSKQPTKILPPKTGEYSHISGGPNCPTILGINTCLERSGKLCIQPSISFYAKMAGM
jgi:hypothetical protein